MKGGEKYLDWLNDSLLLKKDSAPWSCVLLLFTDGTCNSLIKEPVPLLEQNFYKFFILNMRESYMN
jgi:hypothetical protein